MGVNLCLRMLKRLLSMSWVQIRRVSKKIKKYLVSPISSFHLRHPSHLGMISPIYVHLRYLSHSHFTTIQNYLCISTDLNSAHSQLSTAILTYFRAWVLAEKRHRGKPDPTFSLHMTSKFLNGEQLFEGWNGEIASGVNLQFKEHNILLFMK